MAKAPLAPRRHRAKRDQLGARCVACGELAEHLPEGLAAVLGGDGYQPLCKRHREQIDEALRTIKRQAG